MTTPMFDDLLVLVAERSAALRSAVAGHLADKVPGCPGWTGRDLAAHIGEVQRFWAAAVAAGPVESPPAVEVKVPSDDLAGWLADSTEQLVAALRAAGPDRGAWTWWREPRTAGAIARHQVQEAAVHAFDAQETAGRPEPLPPSVALDGVGEFLGTVLASSASWPHPPATVGLVAADADGSWLVSLGPDGVSTSRGEGGADAVLRGPASDLVLGLYRRRDTSTLDVTGDPELVTRFLAVPDTE